MLNYTNPMAMLCRAMQRETKHRADRAVPQRAGHRRDAGQLDRRADGGDHLHLRRHQPHGLVSGLQVEGQDAYPLIRKAITERPEVYNEEHGAQRDVPGAGLLCHRIQRAQFGIQLVVPQAPGPDRKVLHARHRLEPRRICLYRSSTMSRAADNWRDDAKKWLADETPIALERGHEYAAYIINALEGGEPFEFNGNVRQPRAGDQPARQRLCRGAGVGQPQRASGGARRRAAASMRHADRAQRRRSKRWRSKAA